MLGACSVRLLGAFAVAIDGKPVPPEAWRHRRGADLVKLLALAPGHHLHREQLTDTLWPGLEPEAAAANLRKAVHYARRALGSPHAIEADRDLLQLWPRGELTVDVTRFEKTRDPDLYTGELLPADRYAEWTEPRRDQLKQLCLERLRATARWEEVLELDPADEEAHRALMRRYLGAGQRDAAIRQFYRLRDVLRVDLGVAPAEETIALFESALAERQPLLPAVRDRAQALIARGLLAWGQGDLDTAAALAEEVRRLAIEHHLARELGEASVLVGMTAYVKGEWRERFRAEFEEAVRLPAETSAEVFDVHLCLAETALSGVDIPGVAGLARELLGLAEREGSIRGRAFAALMLGEAESARGELEEAADWLTRAYADAQQGRSRSMEAVALLHLAGIQPLPQAHQSLARVLPLAAESPIRPHLVVRVHATALARAASVAEVERTMAAAETELRPGEFCGPCSIGFRINAVHACIRTGELARARHCLAIAEALSGMWQGGPWRAAAWEARAALREAEGDAETAAGLLREAGDLFAEYGRRLDAQRCADRLVRNVSGTAAV